MNLNLKVFIQLRNTVKDGAYVQSLDEYNLIGTHRIAFYVNLNSFLCNDNALIALVLNTFQEKSKKLLATITSQQISSKYRSLIR